MFPYIRIVFLIETQLLKVLEIKYLDDSTYQENRILIYDDFSKKV